MSDIEQVYRPGQIVRQKAVAGLFVVTYELSSEAGLVPVLQMEMYRPFTLNLNSSRLCKPTEIGKFEYLSDLSRQRFIQSLYRACEMLQIDNRADIFFYVTKHAGTLCEVESEYIRSQIRSHPNKLSSE